jgi:hypothetical protein
MAFSLDDAEAGAESTRHPFGSRKRKWTNELDALLLREVKLHKPHGKRHGRKGNVYEIIAASLNESKRLPWRTHRKHLQGRVQHLLEARRTDQRATARDTGIEEEYCELEILLDDVIEEADTFKSTEMERREVRRDRDFAMAEGGRQARMLARARQAPVDDSDEERDVQRGENISDGESETKEPQQVGRERRSSTPVSFAQKTYQHMITKMFRSLNCCRRVLRRYLRRQAAFLSWTRGS